MSGKACCFFPHNPFPPRSGAHRRCLEMLAGLCDLGFDVTLIGSSLMSETRWAEGSVEGLKAANIKSVTLHRPSLADYALVAPIVLWNRAWRRTVPLDSSAYSPPGLRRLFRHVLEDTSPDLILMNYAFFDGLLDHDQFARTTRVIDTHDLLTLNNRMREALAPFIPRGRLDFTRLPEEILREDYFTRLPPGDLSRECRIYDRYNWTLAITAQDAQLIQSSTRHTRVLTVPMTQPVPQVANTYSGPCLFPAGNNEFNVQGYAYFVKRVLPRIRIQAPDFCLRVTGTCCPRLPPADGVCLAGFVPDLQEVYATSRLTISPVLGCTGQQVKIVEAMGHGVPVVATVAAGTHSPIRHGVNGFIAPNAEAFAEYVLKLWLDQKLCRKLGEQARETIARECSREKLLAQLAQLARA